METSLFFIQEFESEEFEAESEALLFPLSLPEFPEEGETDSLVLNNEDCVTVGAEEGLGADLRAAFLLGAAFLGAAFFAAFLGADFFAPFFADFFAAFLGAFFAAFLADFLAPFLADFLADFFPAFLADFFAAFFAFFAIAYFWFLWFNPFGVFKFPGELKFHCPNLK